MLSRIPLTAGALQASLIGNLVGLALVAILAAGWWWHAGSLRAERDTANQKLGAATSARESALEAERAALTARDRALASARIAAAALLEERTAKAEALALAEAAEAKAIKARVEFERRWATRSSSCGAALIDMQRACATDIGDY
jgi:hypothetical protein